MEKLSQENVNQLAEVLRRGNLDNAIDIIQIIIDAAINFKDQHPDATIEELAEMFDKVQEELLRDEAKINNGAKINDGAEMNDETKTTDDANER